MSAARTNGEGTVYKRRDGRWEGAAYLRTPSGKRRRISVYGRTRAEANGKLIRHLAEAERGIPIPERSWTVAAYLDYWMREVAPIRRQPRTMELYESTIRVHLKPRLGGVLLSQLSVMSLQKLLNEQLAEGHSARVVQITRTVLSAALTNAVREEMVTRNVARLVVLPAGERKPFTPWTDAEARRFLTAAHGQRLYAAFLLLILYGMRRGEVLGLRWSDIDWDAGQIRIRQQLQQIGGALHVGPLKTKASLRTLPMLDPARLALLQHQARTAEQQTDSDLVFLSEDGTPLWPRNFVRTFHHIRSRAGLRRIKLHHLRHTAATLLKKFGVPDRDTQLILGHAHISTTQQIYQHADADVHQTALDRVGRVLLMSADDGRHSRQIQPSNAKSVVINASIISGGPGGARTLDTLLKRSLAVGERNSLTSVRKQQRAHANTQILGYVAVRNSRQKPFRFRSPTRSFGHQ